MTHDCVFNFIAQFNFSKYVKKNFTYTIRKKEGENDILERLSLNILEDKL